MRDADPYPLEQQRLESLKRIRMFDTPIEERFERLTRMVCRLLDVPIALFNLIDDKQQFYKSVQGLTATHAALEGAFCPHAFHEPDMLLVPNASNDERFFDNPFVTGKYLNIGFYAGCAVKTPDGMPVGTLCAIDLKPRDMTPDQLASLRDITAMIEGELKLAFMQNEKQQLESDLEQATRLAMIDPLSRLWNRAGMEAMLTKEWADARRNSKPITLVMADIDHFKKLNDTYGHDLGDEVIRSVAKKLLEGLRTEDHVCRVGGEEFLMILPNCPAEHALEIVDRLRQSIAASTLAQTPIGWPVTMSFGVATVVPDQDMQSASVIKKADAALYQSKTTGRNRVTAAP